MRPLERPVANGPARVLVLVGTLLHLAVAVFPLAASGLLAPVWAVAALYIAWALLGLAAWRLRASRPWAPLAAAVITVVLWFAVIALGEKLLGWTA